MTLSKLTKLTFDYGNGKSINAIINDTYNYYSRREKNQSTEQVEILDKAIKEIFQVLRHWFEYKVPKWLTVINSLQEYVSTQKGFRSGNYLHYANLIENSSLPLHLTLLLEYNIPVSAIKKISQHIPESVLEDDLMNYIRKNQLSKIGSLIKYESKFFE